MCRASFDGHLFFVLMGVRHCTIPAAPPAYDVIICIYDEGQCGRVFDVHGIMMG